MSHNIDWTTSIENISATDFIEPAANWSVLEGECNINKIGKIIFGTLVMQKSSAISSSGQETAGTIAAQYRTRRVLNTFGVSGYSAYSATATLYAYFGTTGLIVRAASTTDTTAKVNFAYVIN